MIIREGNPLLDFQLGVPTPEETLQFKSPDLRKVDGKFPCQVFINICTMLQIISSKVKCRSSAKANCFDLLL